MEGRTLFFFSFGSVNMLIIDDSLYIDVLFCTFSWIWDLCAYKSLVYNVVLVIMLNTLCLL